MNIQTSLALTRNSLQDRGLFSVYQQRRMDPTFRLIRSEAQSQQEALRLHHMQGSETPPPSYDPEIIATHVRDISELTAGSSNRMSEQLSLNPDVMLDGLPDLDFDSHTLDPDLERDLDSSVSVRAAQYYAPVQIGPDGIVPRRRDPGAEARGVFREVGADMNNFNRATGPVSGGTGGGGGFGQAISRAAASGTLGLEASRRPASKCRDPRPASRGGISGGAGASYATTPQPGLERFSANPYTTAPQPYDGQHERISSDLYAGMPHVVVYDSEPMTARGVGRGRPVGSVKAQQQAVGVGYHQVDEVQYFQNDLTLGVALGPAPSPEHFSLRSQDQNSQRSQNDPTLVSLTANTAALRNMSNSAFSFASDSTSRQNAGAIPKRPSDGTSATARALPTSLASPSAFISAPQAIGVAAGNCVVSSTTAALTVLSINQGNIMSASTAVGNNAGSSATQFVPGYENSVRIEAIGASTSPPVNNNANNRASSGFGSGATVSPPLATAAGGFSSAPRDAAWGGFDEEEECLAKVKKAVGGGGAKKSGAGWVRPNEDGWGPAPPGKLALMERSLERQRNLEAVMAQNLDETAQASGPALSSQAQASARGVHPPVEATRASISRPEDNIPVGVLIDFDDDFCATHIQDIQASDSFAAAESYEHANFANDDDYAAEGSCCAGALNRYLTASALYAAMPPLTSIPAGSPTVYRRLCPGHVTEFEQNVGRALTSQLRELTMEELTVDRPTLPPFAAPQRSTIDLSPSLPDMGTLSGLPPKPVPPPIRRPSAAISSATAASLSGLHLTASAQSQPINASSSSQQKQSSANQVQAPPAQDFARETVDPHTTPPPTQNSAAMNEITTAQQAEAQGNTLAASSATRLTQNSTATNEITVQAQGSSRAVPHSTGPARKTASGRIASLATLIDEADRDFSDTEDDPRTFGAEGDGDGRVWHRPKSNPTGYDLVVCNIPRGQFATAFDFLRSFKFSRATLRNIVAVSSLCPQQGVALHRACTPGGDPKKAEYRMCFIRMETEADALKMVAKLNGISIVCDDDIEDSVNLLAEFGVHEPME